MAVEHLLHIGCFCYRRSLGMALSSHSVDPANLPILFQFNFAYPSQKQMGTFAKVFLTCFTCLQTFKHLRKPSSDKRINL